MDKNIKAELSSLKTEIINGLNGIEKLILSLDSKIDNSQLNESSNLHSAIEKFWPDMNKIKSVEKNALVDEMKDIMATINNVENSQDIFVKEWNNNFKKRYDIIKSKLDTFLLMIKNHKRPETRVASNHDAQIAVKEFESLEILKNKINTLITKHTYSDLLMIVDSKCDNLFVKYYDCLNKLADDIRILELGVGLFEQEFLRVLQIQYRMLLEDHEMDMYELSLIDPDTFKPKEIPADKQTAYKTRQYTNYKRDLSNAYKHVSSTKIELANKEYD